MHSAAVGAQSKEAEHSNCDESAADESAAVLVGSAWDDRAASVLHYGPLESPSETLSAILDALKQPY